MDKVNISEPLLITEGEFDCLSAIEAGFKNAVSIPSGVNSTNQWITSNWTFIEQFEEVIIWFDNDEAGIKGAREVFNRLPNSIVKIVRCEIANDINELLHKFGKLAVLKQIEKASTPALDGVATLDMIEDFDVLNKRQQAALASAYALLNSTYNEYREKVVELLGEEADIEIKNEIAKDKYDANKVIKATEEPEPNDICLFFEEFRGQYFETTLQTVKDAEYQLNRKLALHDYAELNDFYKFMQLPPTEYGAILGWSTWASGEFYGYEWIEFHHIKDILPDGTEYYRIEMPFPPTEDYLDW